MHRETEMAMNAWGANGMPIGCHAMQCYVMQWDANGMPRGVSIDTFSVFKGPGAEALIHSALSKDKGRKHRYIQRFEGQGAEALILSTLSKAKGLKH